MNRMISAFILLFAVHGIVLGYYVDSTIASAALSFIGGALIGIYGLYRD